MIKGTSLEWLFDMTDPSMWSHLPHFEHPKNDNEKLLEYQYQYLVNHNQQAWQKMWELALHVAGKFITTESTKRQLYLERNTKQAKAMDAVMNCMARYKQGSSYGIVSSFTSMIHREVMCVLFHRTKGQECWDRAAKMAEEENLPIDVCLEYTKGKMKEEQKLKKEQKEQKENEQDLSLQFDLFQNSGC